MTTIELVKQQGDSKEENLQGAPRSYYREVAWRFMHDPVAVISLGVLLIIILSSVFAPLITASDPLGVDILNRLLPVGSENHPFGTDEQGRDMVARILYGGQLSLLAGITPVLVATIVGTLIGAIAAYFGGIVETVLMRIMDVSYAFPALLLSIGVAAALGQGMGSAIIAITIVLIPPISRVAEAATRQVIVQEYIEASRLSGANPFQIIQHQLLPNIASPIFVYSSGLVGLSIVIASGLSFLGLGSAPPAPEWGSMLNNMRGSLYVEPLVVALPGFLIFITSVAFNVLSDSFRDALDVKSI